MQQKSQMKEQAVRIGSIHQKVYRWRRQQLGSGCGSGRKAIESIPGNEGRLAQAWVNVKGGLRVFSVYFWHSEGWTVRNEAPLEAVLKQARTTRHTWLIACDANMCPEDFEKILWFQRGLTRVVAPKEASLRVAEQKMPKVLPGYSGGRLPGRSTKEKGREGAADEDGGGGNEESNRSKNGCMHHGQGR